MSTISSKSNGRFLPRAARQLKGFGRISGLCLLLVTAMAEARPLVAAPAPDTLTGARVLLSIGEYDSAGRSFRQLAKAQPSNAEARFEYGRYLLALRKPEFDAAIAEFSAAVELDGKNSAYHLWLARAYGVKIENSNIVAAAFGPVWKVKSHFEKAVELEPKNNPARVDLFQYYLFAPGIAGGGREKAQEQLLAIARNEPGGYLDFMSQAIFALEKADWEAVDIAYQRLLQLEPKQAGQLRLQYATVMISQGKYDRAIQILKAAASSDSDIDPPFKILQPSYVRNGYYERVRYELEHNVKVDVSGMSVTRRQLGADANTDSKFIECLRLLGGLYDKFGHKEMATLFFARVRQAESASR